MTPVIRAAVRADVPQIFHLLQEMHRELPMMPVDLTKSLAFIDHVLETGFILVAEVDGRRIVGSIGVGPDQWWFSDRWFLADYWTYVSKGHRRSRIAVQMFTKIKEFADRTSMPLMMGVFSIDQVNRKNKLYRKHFKSMGEIFFHGLDCKGI